MNFFHLKHVCQLSTMYSLIPVALLRLETTILSTVLALCRVLTQLYLAAGSHKDSCCFSNGFEDAVILREPTTEMNLWNKLLKRSLHV